MVAAAGEVLDPEEAKHKIKEASDALLTFIPDLNKRKMIKSDIAVVQSLAQDTFVEQFHRCSHVIGCRHPAFSEHGFRA